MHEKRYQVFISSTFEDLKDERRAVQDVVISTGDFPVQMESFPAADEDQFEFIKSLINMCDYYILIIAGRYGTISDDGLSYTHKEFRYAVSQEVPVLVMLHNDLNKIEAGKSEKSDDGRQRLTAFIAEAQTGRLRKTWSSLEGLKLAVREALDNAKATKPRIGWIRGNAVTSVEALEELNEVRKENDKFKKALGDLEIELSMPPIPDPNSTIMIDLLANNNGWNQGTDVTVQASWIAFFPIFHSNLKWRTSDWDGEYKYYVEETESYVAIGSAIAENLASIDTSGSFKINKSGFQRLMDYYIEAGLMNPIGHEEPFTETAQKIARRHSISGNPSTSFKIVQGEINITPISKPTVDGLDDEIPF